VRGESSWDIPAGSVFGAASPAAAKAGGVRGAGGPAAAACGAAPAPLPKIDDTRVYWQTFIDSDGAPYYFQEDAGTTTYEEPREPVTVKGGARVFPILLPPGWLAAADASGEVYFADEQDNTAWELLGALDGARSWGRRRQPRRRGLAAARAPRRHGRAARRRARAAVGECGRVARAQARGRRQGLPPPHAALSQEGRRLVHHGKPARARDGCAPAQ